MFTFRRRYSLVYSFNLDRYRLPRNTMVFSWQTLTRIGLAPEITTSVYFCAQLCTCARTHAYVHVITKRNGSTERSTTTETHTHTVLNNNLLSQYTCFYENKYTTVPKEMHMRRKSCKLRAIHIQETNTVYVKYCSAGVTATCRYCFGERW